MLYYFVEEIRILNILCAPFMPGLSPKISRLIGRNTGAWEEAGRWGLTAPGTKVEKGEPLFPRVDILQLIDGEDKAMEFEPIKEEVSIEDFAKLDFRVAKVVKAEKVEKTDKLLKLEMEIAGEVRTVVSGIAQHYAPEDLIGRKVVVVANLKPAKLRGIMSQGMILAASHGDTLEVLMLDKNLPGGARVK